VVEHEANPPPRKIVTYYNGFLGMTKDGPLSRLIEDADEMTKNGVFSRLFKV
jgi:hypothetical protein